MNALLVYPELPPSFWSAPQALRFSAAKALFAPLGPITIAALLPKDWNFKFVDCNVRELTEKDWNWADIIMISGMIAQRNGFHAIIEEANKRAKISVAGGPYPTLMADALIEKGCDYVICGEAENAIKSLLNALSSDKRGQIISHTERPDLTDTPIPRYDLLNLKDYLFFLCKPPVGVHLVVNSAILQGYTKKCPVLKNRP